MAEPAAPTQESASEQPTAPASGPVPASDSPAPAAGKRAGRRTRISAFRTGLIAGVLIMILLVIFIIQNTAAVKVSFFGAHARLPLAIALLIAAIAGALLMAAAGTARITQLRRNIRSTRRARTSQLASTADPTRPG